MWEDQISSSSLAIKVDKNSIHKIRYLFNYNYHHKKTFSNEKKFFTLNDNLTTLIYLKKISKGRELLLGE